MVRIENGSLLSADYYMVLNQLNPSGLLCCIDSTGPLPDHRLPFMVVPMDTIPAAADTQPSHWKYVSEGGATIVFSYTGPANPQFDGTVLRLRKASRTTGLADDAVDPIVEFQKRCTSRLISPIHLPRLQSASLEKDWMQRMIALHDDLRPAERRTKDYIDPARSKGVLATDLVGGNWVAVEIKVKYLILTWDHPC